MAKFTPGVPRAGASRTRPPAAARPVRHRQDVAGAHAPRSRPRLDTATWTFTVEGLVEQPTTWTWDEIHALPPSTYEGDIHCVTTWSKLGMTFAGVSVDTLLDVARPAADRDARARVLAHRLHDEPAARRRHRRARRGSCGSSTASRCQREHGGPARLLVPHLYFWKSAKWVVGPARARPRRARLLGAQRLPRPRRPVARAALPGRLTSCPTARTPRTPWQTATVVAITRRDAAREDVPARARRAVARIAPASTTSCASPRPTATPRRARTRSRRRPTSSNEIELTVERLEDGEVSTFLHDEVEVGDELEVRGPIGGWFVWDGDTPALLVGGGSGVVPLMAMLRLRAPHRRAPTSCGSSCRCARPTTSTTPTSCPARETTVVYTRARAAGVPARRRAALTRDDIAPLVPRPTPPRTCAARPGSPTPPATCSSTSASPWSGSASSGSARPADASHGHGNHPSEASRTER